MYSYILQTSSSKLKLTEFQTLDMHTIIIKSFSDLQLKPKFPLLKNYSTMKERGATQLNESSFAIIVITIIKK